MPEYRISVDSRAVCRFDPLYTSRREEPINDAPLLSKRKAKICRINIYTSVD